MFQENCLDSAGVRLTSTTNWPEKQLLRALKEYKISIKLTGFFKGMVSVKNTHISELCFIKILDFGKSGKGSKQSVFSPMHHFTVRKLQVDNILSILSLLDLMVQF